MVSEGGTAVWARFVLAVDSVQPGWEADYHELVSWSYIGVQKPRVRPWAIPILF